MQVVYFEVNFCKVRSRCFKRLLSMIFMDFMMILLLFPKTMFDLYINRVCYVTAFVFFI